MQFLKNQNLFSLMYNGKNLWDYEMKKNVRENDNKIITELILPDGLKITNIAKKHGDNAYEWVNCSKIPVRKRRISYPIFGIVIMSFRSKRISLWDGWHMSRIVKML